MPLRSMIPNAMARVETSTLMVERPGPIVDVAVTSVDPDLSTV